MLSPELESKLAVENFKLKVIRLWKVKSQKRRAKNNQKV